MRVLGLKGFGVEGFGLSRDDVGMQLKQGRRIIESLGILPQQGRIQGQIRWRMRWTLGLCR